MRRTTKRSTAHPPSLPRGAGPVKTRRDGCRRRARAAASRRRDPPLVGERRDRRGSTSGTMFLTTTATRRLAAAAGRGAGRRVSPTRSSQGGLDGGAALRDVAHAHGGHPRRELERRGPVDRIARVLACVAARCRRAGARPATSIGSPSSAQSRATAPFVVHDRFGHVMELAHVVVDAAPGDQRLARHDRLRDAFAALQAADDRQRDARGARAPDVRTRETISSCSGASIALPTRPPEKRARTARASRAVSALRAKRRALQERVGRLQRARLARRDQQTERVHARRSRTDRRDCPRRGRRRRPRCPDRELAQHQPLVAHPSRTADRRVGRRRRTATAAGCERASCAPARRGASRFRSSHACSPPSGDVTPNSVCWRGARKSRSTTTTRRPSPAIDAARLETTTLLPMPRLGGARPR